ncbi:MAG: uroporphyrinogen decarboxylase family protein, partial [Niameybacter sp.]
MENVTYMALDDTDEFDELMGFMEMKHNEAAKISVDSPADCVMIPENISSECIGKEFYHKYMEGYHTRWNSEIKRQGKFSFVHQDGTVRGLVSELSRNSKFDVIEAVTPAPVGDVTIDDVNLLVDDNTIIWGG